MIGRIVELAEDGRHLRLDRGHLVVSQQDQEVGRVPVDDVAAVIGNAHGLTFTNNALVALAQRGAAFVLCGSNHNVEGMLLAVGGHWNQARRLDAQIAARLPLRKRLWAQVVRAKLLQQAAVLESYGRPSAPLCVLARGVQSGDPDNREAQGARRYWIALFGDSFRRDSAAGGVNALLNYGYAVMRAATARSVIAAGLHPTLSLHHSNESNALRLVDDLMEPFRPLIDHRVRQLLDGGEAEVNPSAKRSLASVLYEDLQLADGRSPLMACIHRAAVSLAQVYVGERKALDLPAPLLPAED